MRMPGQVRKVFTTGLAVWLACFCVVSGVAAQPHVQEEHASIVALKVGKITGTVTSADPRTPLAGVVLQVLDEKGRLVTQTTTSEAGIYVLGPLEPGKYRLLLAGRVVTEVEVTRDAKLTKLNFILPRPVYNFLAADLVSGAAAEARADEAPRHLPAVLIALTATAAVVIPLVAVIARRDREKKVVFVSPSIP